MNDLNRNEEKRYGPIIGWLVDRFGFIPIKRHVLDHRVTKSPWTYGDGSALFFLFLVLLVTGAFLSLDYSPSPENAYESVRILTSESAFSRFIRALHYWSGGMMVVVAVVHMLRHLLLGGYKPPREGTWIVGLILFVLVLTNSFIGYTLRWDERAIYGIRLVLVMFSYVPFIGEDLVEIVQGGWQVGASTLSRLYAVHVIFVPLGILALSAYHLYLVIIHGVTTLAERRIPIETSEEQKELRHRVRHSEKGGHEFFPFTVASSGTFALIAFLIVLALTVFLGPQELGPRANFNATPMPREEWWFSWYSALMAYLPPWIAPWVYVFLPLGSFLVLLALPFIDRGPNRGYRNRPYAVAFVGAIVVVLFTLSGLRLRSAWTAWPRDDLPQVPETVELTPEIEEGRRLFAAYGCHNCHAVGDEGPGVGPNLADLDTRISKAELKRFILQPPADAAMPSYDGRLTESELQRIVDFVLVAQTFPRGFTSE